MSLLAIAIVVQLSNVADVPAPVLRDAQLEATRMFAAVGVAIEWTSGSTSADTIGDRESVRLLIVDQEAGKLRTSADAVLGAATSTALGTRIAWAYYKRIEDEANRNTVPVSTVLACAMAHEIGHLLMPGRDHSPAGLMRARWSPRDFHSAALGVLRFSDNEGAHIRANLDHTSAPR